VVIREKISALMVEYIQHDLLTVIYNKEAIMCNRVTCIIVMMVLLISYSFINGCTPDRAAMTDPDDSDSELLPEPLTAPPRPDTPFVFEKQALLLHDDFKSGNINEWELGAGWAFHNEDDNHFLAGSEHGFVRPNVHNWSDYTVETRFKLVKGSFHFNLRENQHGGHIRYSVSVSSGGMDLHRQVVSDFFLLDKSAVAPKLNQWHTIRASLEHNNIKVFLDEELVFNYVDNEIPLLTGITSFETMDNSLLYLDDVTVNGTQLVQRTTWERTGGPSGGLGYDVRIHPSNRNIIFVTDNPSGVNKSYDAGVNWVQRNEGITARGGASGDGIPIFCLTIDPNNPDIVWAGTQGMRGIFKSTDGGETWFKKDNGIKEFWDITIRGFAVHPQNSDTVLAAAEINTGKLGNQFYLAKGKIYRTEDGGDNWSAVWQGDNLARVILFNYENPDIVYASTGIFDVEPYNKNGVGVLKSTDGGKNWRQINNGLENLNVGFLEMHPSDPNILFAAVGNHYYLEHNGIYRTLDGGENWTKVLPVTSGYQSSIPMTVVAISPSEPDVVYAGDDGGFYRSSDGGNRWVFQNVSTRHGYGPPGVRAGIPISAVVDPYDSDVIYVNNYNGGVFKSTDGGVTWSNNSTGYTGADLHAVSVDPNNPDTVYAVGRSGPFRSFDGGATWQGIAFSPAYFAEWNNVVINPDDPKELLLSDEFLANLLKSRDGGNSWSLVYADPMAESDYSAEGRHGVKAISYAPSNSKIIYMGLRMDRRTINGEFSPKASYGIFKSVNGGDSWENISSTIEVEYLNINDIKVHPNNPDIVYAATWRDGIYKTTDGGKSWAAVNNGLFALDVRSLTIDPTNPEILYAGLAEGVGIFKTTDGGDLWEAINAGIIVHCPSFLQRVGQVQPGISLELPQRIAGGDYYSIPWTNIESMVIDPSNSRIIYAADYFRGVYMSPDAGESWVPINEGLSTTAVKSLSISADGWILYAATSGAGVFKLQLW
jgi:photosystem II stability/assembly factor-like uncharacterized protein